MQGFTAKEYKASIERAAKSACATWPHNPELRARSFCALLSFELGIWDPALASVLDRVAGIPSTQQPDAFAQ